MERRTFTAEFKREAVRLGTQAGNSKTEVARSWGYIQIYCVAGCGNSLRGNGDAHRVSR